MSDWMQYAIVCPLIFLGGFVDAIAGGGGLITLPAYLIAGLPVHMSIGTNKLSSFMGSSITTWKFWKRGYIKPKLSLVCAACSLVGSAIGANIALHLSDRIFKMLLLVILPLTAVYVMRTKTIGGESREPLSPGRTMAACAAIALALGAYDGFYGPGSGTFMLLLLTGVARLSLNDAAGTTKVINLCANIAALVTYLLNGQGNILLGFTAGLFGIAGCSLGVRCFTAKGSRIVKPLITVVLCVFFIRVVYEMITG